MTLLIYLVGWIILIGGVSWGLMAMHVAQHTIAIVAVIRSLPAQRGRATATVRSVSNRSPAGNRTVPPQFEAGSPCVAGICAVRAAAASSVPCRIA